MYLYVIEGSLPTNIHKQHCNLTSYLTMYGYSYIHNYIYHLQVTINITTGTVIDLSPFTEYSCTVSAFTVSPGPVSNSISVTTAQSGIT